MASANVELVRSIGAAWERGDFRHSAQWAHPEIEFVFADGPTPGSWKGLASMEQFFRDFVGAWERHRLLPEEYRELDGDRVLALGHAVGQGKRSELDLAQVRTAGATLVHIREGKVTRLVVYSRWVRAGTNRGAYTARDAIRRTG